VPRDRRHELNNYNWKITWVPFQNNRFNFQNTWAEKYKNARDASDTRPIETTFIQSAVPKEYGKWGWDVGPSPLWKASATSTSSATGGSSSSTTRTWATTSS
jgi:hypothetical protein